MEESNKELNSKTEKVKNFNWNIDIKEEKEVLETVMIQMELNNEAMRKNTKKDIIEVKKDVLHDIKVEIKRK